MSETEMAEEASPHADETEILIGLKRYQEALAACSRAIASDPEEPNNHYNLARIHLLLKQYREALEAARQVIILAPEWPYGFYLMSICLHNRLDFAGELQAAEHAASLDPEDPALLDRLARALMQSGLLKRARETAAQLISVSPEDADTHSLLSDICFELNDFDCAETHLLEALRQSPEDPVLHNDRGRIAMGKKRWREAVDAFYQAARLQPSENSYQNNLNLAISEWLEHQGWRGRKKQALEELPPEIRAFYHHRLDIRTPFQRLGIFGPMLVTLAILAVLMHFFNAIL